MTLARCVAVVALAAGTATGASAPVVETRSELSPAPSNASARDVLRRFADAYRVELVRRSAGNAAAKGWVFRAVLRPDPSRGGIPHILVVGLVGRWIGRVGEFPVRPGSDVHAEAVLAAARSLALMAHAPGGRLEENPPPKHTASAAHAR
jgi:hypothetical protein